MPDIVNTPEAAYTDQSQPVERPVAAAEIPVEQQTQETQPVQAAPEPVGSSEPVNILGPDGELSSVAPHELEAALAAGYTKATPEDVHNYTLQQEHGGVGSQFGAAAEGALKGVAGPFAGGIEKAFGASPENILAREEANPIASGLGQMGGLTGSMLTGFGEGAIAAKAGQEALGALGIAAPVSNVAKIGSAAVKGAVENMVISGSDEVNKMILQDPAQSLPTAIADVGLSGLLGGAIGGSIEGISPLWKATVGRTLGGKLQGLTDKVGGVEGVEAGSIDEVLNRHFPDLAPEVRSALSTDPKVRSMVSTLNQSDTTSSGRAFQESTNKFRSGIQEHLVDSLGKTPDELHAMPEINNYDRGHSIGKTLADEYSAQIDPVSKEFESLKERAKNTPLEKDIYESSDPYAQNNNKIAKPGTSSQIADTIGGLVSRESWAGSDDIMKEVNRVIKKLPNLETLKDLTTLGTEIGNNTASTLPFGQQTPLSRAGMMIKSVLRDAENDAIERSLAEKAAKLDPGSLGPKEKSLVERFKEARAAYAQQAGVKEALDDRLGVRGSISGFSKGLKEMARTDGEALIRKLSGKNDADLLRLLEERFPKTAAELKQYHLDSLLQKAASKATQDNLISSKVLLKGIDSLDPNLKEFIFSPKVAGVEDPRTKIAAMSKLLERLDDPTHNFSNTARVADKLLAHLPGTAIGAASLLTGHNVVSSAILGGLGKLLGRDAPDAIKLALLKFLGSGREIQPAAFKTMVDYIHSVRKGEELTGKATRAVFKAGREVLPSKLYPTERDREALDKNLKSIQKDPSKLMNAGNAVSHYMPEHGTQAAMTAATAVNYLNGIRPTGVKQTPMDSKPVVSTTAKAAYDSALNIAQQPLIVLDKVKNGTVTTQDINHLQNMYPGMYNKLVTDLMTHVNGVMAKGDSVPYNTRLGLSTFIGQPLDSTMTPQAILSAQPLPTQQPTEPQSGGQKPPSGSSMKGLSKLPQSYQTPAQNRQADKQNH